MKLITVLTLVLITSQSIAAGVSRTLTLVTDQHRCQIQLTENFNSAATGPGGWPTQNETIHLRGNGFKSATIYEYSYQYAILRPPQGVHGGVQISLSAEDDTLSLTVTHEYPLFPTVIMDKARNLPEGMQVLASMNLPMSQPSSVLLKLSSLINYERVFGVPYISNIYLICKP